MYINFWYPIVLDKELTAEESQRVEILGVKLAVFRDSEGKPAVIADTCVHRGGSLGKGTVKDGNVVCPYHGWAFNKGGECVDIPTLNEGDYQIPSRAKVDAYPTEVKYGIVFAFLGDLPEAERPPIAWEAEEFDDPEWGVCDIHVFDVDYYYERSIENGLDPAHNEYVHPNQGAPTPTRDWKKEPIEIVKEDFASHFTLLFIRHRQGLLGADAAGVKAEGGGELIIAGSGHLGPNSVVTWIQPQETQKYRQYFFEAPINEEKTKIFFLTTRSTMIDEDFDEDIMEINLSIAQEDVDVVKEINPIRTPNSNIKEVLVPTDAPIISYRDYLKQWEAKGWKIDWKKAKSLKGDVAFAIPSPGRRESKGWVLDAIPLVSTDS